MQEGTVGHLNWIPGLRQQVMTYPCSTIGLEKHVLEIYFLRKVVGNFASFPTVSACLECVCDTRSWWHVLLLNLCWFHVNSHSLIVQGKEDSDLIVKEWNWLITWLIIDIKRISEPRMWKHVTTLLVPPWMYEQCRMQKNCCHANNNKNKQLVPGIPSIQ